MEFKISSHIMPAGDQPKAISELIEGIKKGKRFQTLLGVTGSGKTFTVANIIQATQKPTLVIAHNKTLAAQLCNEFRELFPKNSVHYFVSYYDYYQPEAYMPTTDTYIGKEAMVNDEIDKLRHAATTALLTRKDVIIVASVSCIYGLGDPDIYKENIIHLRAGDTVERPKFSRRLIELQFTRTNADLVRGSFRMRGEIIEIMPPDRERVCRLEVERGVLKQIYDVDPVNNSYNDRDALKEIYIGPAKHFITPVSRRDSALNVIREELKERLKYFENNKLYLEAERLERRTKFDLAMIREVGYCHGIENYSRPLSGKSPGEPPATLLDYFEDFLTIIDESHVTVSQIEGMHAGDASRKKTLIEYGFRLPSAADNRPLTFKEFNERVGNVIFTSATPGKYEREVSSQIVEQVIRPTGLVDPKISILPARGQVDDVMKRIEERLERGNGKERVLITTLTKKMAEDLCSFLSDKRLATNDIQQDINGHESSVMSRKLKVAYLHSDVKTMDRIRILTNLRKGSEKGGFDVLVGVNLLREGLDLPEVSLVAILDADKEGFLRSETSLIQTIGRAARNVQGEVILYADQITGSIERAVRETERRRKIQVEYNKKHNITPRSIVKKISDIIPVEEILKIEAQPIPKTKAGLSELVKEKMREMKKAAEALDFELAAILRDEIKILNKEINKKP